MENLLSFISEHWVAILTTLACVIVLVIRLIPTSKTADALRKILELIDFIIPDRKKGGGKFTSKSVSRD